MTKVQEKLLGTFRVDSGAVVVSDPCYEMDGSLQEVLDHVAKGEWVAMVKRSDEGDWGIRNAELIAYHKISGQPLDHMWKFHSSNVAVDSGQAGFYDKDKYRIDEVADGKDKSDFGDNYDEVYGDVWYRYNCFNTLETEYSAGVIDGGVVSSSGYGDGMYHLHISIKSGMVVGLRLMFFGDVCSYCDNYEASCSCTFCDYCGEAEDYCNCEYCHECGLSEGVCECDYDDDDEY